MSNKGDRHENYHRFLNDWIIFMAITLPYGHTWKNKCVNLNWRFARFLWRRLPLPTNSEYVNIWEGKLKIECECCWCVHLGCCMHVCSIVWIVFNILIKTHENTTLYEKKISENCNLDVHCYSRHEFTNYGSDTNWA